MKLRRTTIWVMVIALVFGFTGIGWNLRYLQDADQVVSGGQERTVLEDCDDLRDFITAEEDVSFPLWKIYHREVMKYAEGLPRSERVEMVRGIAAKVTEVLNSDLRIYKEMKRLPHCLESEFRTDIQEWISTTKEMIEYLEGSREIEGARFDPEDGLWDTTFYDAFYSAAENLISGLQNI